MFRFVLVVICALVSIPSISISQNLLHKPESVVFDTTHNCYLVSNWDSGDIVRIDLENNQTYFNIQMTRSGGLEIVGDVVYAASNNIPYHGVMGFDLTTGLMVFGVNITGLETSTDLTSDNSGYLYLSDVGSDRIFKISISEGTYTTFVSSGLNDPNGLLFDEDNNRLLVCSNGTNSPIQAVSLEDSTVSIVTPTNHGKYDGLTEDNEGYIYVSSWGYGTVHRWDSEFSEPMELICSGYAAAADIYFNKRDNVLAVPEILDNAVDFVQFDDSDDDGIIDINDNCPADNNPSQDDDDDDNVGNVCDLCPGFDDNIDPDDDSVPSDCDNCPDDPNSEQDDSDYDGVGNVCDNCPDHYNPEQEDSNGNDVGDICDYICGDGDGDRTVNILDIVYLINHLYKNGPGPEPLESADVNYDTLLNILDVVYLINYLYKSGPEPTCP